MLRRILLASAGAMALAGVALAQGGTVNEVLAPQPSGPGLPVPFIPLTLLPPNTPYNWNGVYLGLQIGGAVGHDSANLFVPDTDFSFPYGYSLGGVKGGFHAGWNYQFHPFWLVGLEGSVDGSSFGGTVRPEFLPDHSFATRVDIQGSIRGRFGYVWPACPFLSYITGGVAFAGIRNTYDATAIGGDFITVSRTRVGWTAGGGFQYALTPNWSIGAEYRYIDFDFTDSSPLTIVKVTHDLSENVVQVRLSYRIPVE